MVSAKPPAIPAEVDPPLFATKLFISNQLLIEVREDRESIASHSTSRIGQPMGMKQNQANFCVALIHLVLVMSNSALVFGCMPLPTLAAEQLYFEYGPALFPLSVEALAIYAQDGVVTTEFARYANQFDAQQLAQLRQML